MTISRRRFLVVLATASLGGSVSSSAITRQRFYALGTEAQISLVGRAKQADAAIRACRKEVTEIERAFSLYKTDSILARLNRDGSVVTSDLFTSLLRHALHMAEDTGGAFDPTIQPLWRAYASGGDVEHARQFVGWRGLQLTPRRAYFSKPGMAASLNGIAQGFAADRIADILADYGFHNTLVDLGEFAARGAKQSGPWRLGISDPLSGRIVAPVEVSDGYAIATTEPLGTLIAGHSHIFDPLEQPGERWASVTIAAREAWRADALSTAIAASPVDNTKQLLEVGNVTRAWLIDTSGKLVTL